MPSTSIERCRRWLSEQALPLWLKEGVDRKNGGFFENLSLEGVAQNGPKRAMVQARQIYSFRVALDLKLCASDSARKAVKSGVDFLLENYSLPSGAFINSIDEKMKPLNTSPDLYGQAFALFALANAYAVEPRPELKDRARSLVSYLSRERRVPGGGFTELGDGVTLYQSNPHMHLFEAAVCWMAADGDAAWRNFADEILELCLTKFIDPATGVLGEHFTERWTRLLENNRFVFEPGHQYEWAWLMGLYQDLTGKDLTAIRIRLFEQSEMSGISPDGRAFDQMWSDFTPKLRSSRFWPQCERIKAAAQLGRGAAADEALNTLFRYFDLPVQGLWYDTLETSGQFRVQPAKASSLYHIIGALSEYIRHRTVPTGS
jgi:mannose-6-phosphate isomerase